MAITTVEIKRLVHLFFLMICCFSLHGEETCFFIPPKGWEIANPEILAPRVHICFLGKTSKGLAPSINLASEAVNVSLESYIEEVRKIHTADPNARWRDLGKYKTPLGDGRLTELETPTELGMARMVQLIVIKEDVAYILTASAIKEEFSKYYKTFDQVLRSLQSSSNLIESYPSKSSQLKELVKNITSENFQEEAWKSFENKIINDFTEMGPYWQILFLKEVQTQNITSRVQ